MKPEISVIFCTHNPQAGHLARVLLALKFQHLFLEQWELIIVDSASDRLLVNDRGPHEANEHNCTYPYSNYSTGVDIDWHTQVRLIREERLGLAAARLRGFQAAQGDLLVFVNDDNVLEPNYLLQVRQIFQSYPQLGAIAGKSAPEFESQPEPWIAEFYKVLALRDFGDRPLISPQFSDQEATAHASSYPDFAPDGISLAVRRSAFSAYADHLSNIYHQSSQKQPDPIVSLNQDNDLVLRLMAAGWQIGYFPELQLTQLISAQCLSREYLAKRNYAASLSLVQVLNTHRIRTWRKIPAWTVFPRKAKAFITYKPWRNAASYVRWWGACGLYEGLASLSD